MPPSGTTPFFLPLPLRHWGRVCSPAVSGPQTAILWEAVGHRPLWGSQPGATLLASCRHGGRPPRWRRRCEPGPEFCPRRRRPPSPGCSGIGAGGESECPHLAGVVLHGAPRASAAGEPLPLRLGKDPGRAEPAERDGAPPPLQRSAPGGALEWRRRKALEGRVPLWRPRSMAFSRPASGEIARKPACQFPAAAAAAAAMATTLAKIAEIEAEMARTQKNKATAHHLGLLKARLAKLRRELITPKGGGGGGPGEGFDVAKTGDARIGFVGFPSVGKSTLLSNLAGVYSEVAAYEFTTLTTVPGVIRYKGAKIQLLDLPGIIEGAKDGKGRGRQVIAVARTCNLILIVLDVLKPLGHKKIIETELEGFGIRLNSKPPNIGFKKKDKGGINLTATCPQSELDIDTVKSILAEYKIHNADVTLRSDVTADDLIDVVEGNRVYIPCIYVLNKIDQISIEELDIIYKVPHCVPISAHHRWNFDDLLEKIWDYLKLVRIYTKPKGQLPDYTSPVVLPDSRTTVDDFCMKIHKNLIKDFKYALVWGSSVKHNPQKVGKDHTLEDEDVIQIVKK
ncbi:developmentally-regulated GTP-binding protein 1 [Crotalus adamanteus]|uniref:Developmentally-regulated GTP-binding protein 1 n=3 Tax=Crotalus TaxID=8728 RepID=A0AAW1ANX7_CROAD